jgi:hypothetical protein
VKLTLAVGMALLIVAIVVVLSHAPLTVAGTNSIAAPVPVTTTSGNTTTCQIATLPKGTAGIRVSLSAAAGPKLQLRVYSRSRLLAQGERPAGWGLEANVVIPLSALRQVARNARVCITIGPTFEPVTVLGTPTRAGQAGVSGLEGVALRFEYLRPGPKTWWSLAPSIAYHMGLGHAPSGTWLAFVVLAVMIAVAILTVRQALEGLR